MLADNLKIRAHFEALTARENEKNSLIDNMFRMLQDYEDRMRVLELELNSEKRHRVSSQKNLGQWAKYSSSQNDYVVVLVDGDGAIFNDGFLQKPREGAMDASRKLTQAVRDSLKQEKLIDGENITILIRIFANMNDLSKTLHLSKVISGRGDLSIFAEQFTTSRGEYDFINVGPGKENADSKMRDMLKHYYHNFQCKKIFFAGCHDTGYLNDLQRYTSDEESRDRITLVETTPAQPSFRTMLTFPIIRFDNVFRSTSLSLEDASQQQSPDSISPTASTPIRPVTLNLTPTLLPPGLRARPTLVPKPPNARTAPSWRRDSASSTSTTSSTFSAQAPSSTSTAPSPPSTFSNISVSGNGGISIQYPPNPTTYASACGPGSQQNISLSSTTPSTTRAILYNKHNQRIDAPNKKPADQAAFDSYFAKLAKIKTTDCRGFCNYQYLQGQCRRGAMCHNEHDMVLSEREVAVHRYRARLGLCTNGPTCSDYDCFFSHHCPFVPNCTAQVCKFEVHIEGEDMVVWERWTEGKNGPDIQRRT